LPDVRKEGSRAKNYDSDVLKLIAEQEAIVEV
jgi:hypothetical protein